MPAMLVDVQDAPSGRCGSIMLKKGKVLASTYSSVEKRRKIGNFSCISHGKSIRMTYAVGAGVGKGRVGTLAVALTEDTLGATMKTCIVKGRTLVWLMH